MPSDLHSSLEAMEEALRRLDRQILFDSLQVGLPPAETRAVLQAEGLPSGPAVEDLYEWRNGSSTAGVTAADDIHILPFFYMYSRENAVATHAALKTDSRWRVGWLPLLTNGGGDFYILDLSRPNEAPIRHFRIEESEHPIEFASLEAMVSTVAEALARGIFFVDPRGDLEMDDQVFGDLAGEMNPEIAWWRD